MSFTLRKEVKVVDMIEAEPVYDSNLGVALKEASVKAGENGLVAPMYLQLENFPYSAWTTGNGEIVSGVGTFNGKKDAYVVTLHGGIGTVETGGVSSVIPPDKIIQALRLHNAGEGGLNDVSAVVLNDVYEGKGNEVFQELLDGKRGTLFTPEQVQSGEAQQHVDRFKKLGIVRLVSDYAGSPSGNLELSRLVKGDIDRVNNPEYTDWKVTHPQVLDWSASPERAKENIRRAKAAYRSGKWGVWHIFNDNGFDANQAQVRVPALGLVYVGLIGGVSSGSYGGRFPVVAPEALKRRENFSGQASNRDHPYRFAPQSDVVIPTLDETVRIIMVATKDHVPKAGIGNYEAKLREGLSKFF